MKRTFFLIVLLTLTASVFATSDIAVDPASLSADLLSGDMETQTLTIANEGDSDLEWSLTISEDAFVLNERVLGFYADESRNSSISTNELPLNSGGAFGHSSGTRDEGDVLNEYWSPSPGGATGAVWVGDDLYVLSWSSASVLKVDPQTGELLSSFMPDGNDSPYGIVWDGQYLWIGSSFGNVYGYDLEGNPIGSFSTPVMDFFTLAWDGQNFIVSETWTQINPNFYILDNAGTIIETYSSSFGDYISQIVWVPAHDGGNIWTTNDGSGEIRRLDLSGGQAIEVGGFYLDIFDFRHAITHDGTDLWIIDWDGPYYQVDDGIEELSWLYTDMVSGVVPAGSSQNVEVTFDAAGMMAGDYASDIIIASNDPDENPVIVPATLGVTGAPSISISPDLVDFGELYIDGTYISTVIVSNTGTDVLDITDIQVLGGEFGADETLFSVAPGGYYNLEVSFVPTFTGLQEGEVILSSNDPTNPTITVDLLGTGVTSPDITWNPQSLHSDLFTGDTEVQTLTISNEGGSDLVWEISIEEVDLAPRAVDTANEHPSHYLLDVEKGAVDPRIGPDVIRDAGGPDLFGYSWIDSDEAGGPVFDWEDISGTGMNITGNMSDDNVSGPYPLGFDFDFYGNTYTEFFLSSNGFIRFGESGSSGCCSGQPLPFPDDINNIIAWAWRDGYPFGNTYYENFDDKTIIQFDGYGT
ncbi:choice-of-anchor D domain-containing protein, partial [bacterium]|nr:choice-of-anchor D domain-containing protein [bacterium]